MLLLAAIAHLIPVRALETDQGPNARQPRARDIWV